ncbi:SGNH/GDSL hydrolase family protein [Paenibacillus nicotianae]|uniref:SGNH/GDSL hydrolase family protein n=1 Tax=Paenibacillus nicotianae TaxID=1526551 RepID=A0ABW4USY0_9BACL
MADLIFPDYRANSNASEFTFSSGWTTGQADNSGHNGALYATTSTANEKCTIYSDSIPFTDAVLFMYGSQSAGIAQIYVDGNLYTEQDCYLYIDGQANSMKNAAMVWLKGLTRGLHKIEVVCKGVAGAKSTGTTVGVNYIYYLDPDTPAGQALESRLLIVGDSNSDRQGGWCDGQFKTLLRNYMLGNRIQIDYATRPSGSSDYIRFLRNEIVAKRPAMVQLMLGTNDLPRPEIITKDNIEQAIKICLTEFKIPIQISTILPRNGLNAFGWNKVNGQMRELSQKYHLPLLDLNTYVTNNIVSTTTPMQADGIHLDAVGDNLGAHHFFDVLFSPNNPARKLL